MLSKERKAELRSESKAVPCGKEAAWRARLSSEERQYMAHVDELADLWGGDLDDDPAWREALPLEDQELLQEWDEGFEAGLARLAADIAAAEVERGAAAYGG